MKKILSMILTVAVVLSCGATVFATEDVTLINNEATTEVAVEEPAAMPELTYNKLTVLGKVVSVENAQIVAENGDEFVINTDENTVFLKEDGTAITFEEIKKNSIIKAMVSSVMTMSLPPQTYGYVVMVAEPGTETPAFPIYIEVENVGTNNDGNPTFESADGQYVITPTADTHYLPLKSKKLVTLSDVKYGSELLVFTDVATTSIPAYATTEKVIILEDKVATDLSGVIVNNEYVEMKVVNDNGIYKLPVRFVSEALGLEVGWDGELNKVTVGTVPMGVNFCVGVNEYNKARMMPIELTAEPVLIEDRTYVPLDFFTDVLEAKVKVTDGTISLVRD